MMLNNLPRNYARISRLVRTLRALSSVETISQILYDSEERSVIRQGALKDELRAAQVALKDELKAAQVASELRQAASEVRQESLQVALKDDLKAAQVALRDDLKAVQVALKNEINHVVTKNNFSLVAMFFAAVTVAFSFANWIGIEINFPWLTAQKQK